MIHDFVNGFSSIPSIHQARLVEFTFGISFIRLLLWVSSDIFQIVIGWNLFFLATVITCRRQWKLEIETRSMEIRWTECSVEWNYFTLDQHSGPAIDEFRAFKLRCFCLRRQELHIDLQNREAAANIFNCDFSFCFYLPSKSVLRSAIKGISTAGARSLTKHIIKLQYSHFEWEKERKRATCPAMEARTKKM